MRRRTITTGLVCLLLAGLAVGCGRFPPRDGTRTPSAEERINTAAAQTVSALGTKIASGENVTLGAPTVTITPTPPPTATRGPNTPTPEPTRAPGENTPTPSAGADGTVTPDAPCNAASFVEDVTIPDGISLPPNSPFVKTWALKNTGSCTWTSDYSVVFAQRGQALGGAAASPIVSQGEVKPGETARVSVAMRAPGEPGDYEGYWLLRAPDNKTFGTGAQRAAPFFVKIRVEEFYSFAEHICSARWSSAAGEIPCPGETSPTASAGQGSVRLLENPRLEDNVEREGSALLLQAQPVAGGYIAGEYPPVVVPQAADFRVTLSCAPDAQGCYVRLRLAYKVDGGAEQTLGEWNEGHEGGVTDAAADLDNLAGQAVSFKIYLYTSGPPEQARAILFFPRITR